MFLQISTFTIIIKLLSIVNNQKHTYLMCGSAEDPAYFIFCVFESTDSIHVLLSFTMKLITHYNYIAIPSKNK